MAIQELQPRIGLPSGRNIIGEVTEALYKGLTMAVGERRNRWKGMLSRLRRHDVHAWRNNSPTPCASR